MSERRHDREKSREKAALLSLAGGTDARRDDAAVTRPAGARAGGGKGDAASRHQRARQAREARRQNPLLAELASPSGPYGEADGGGEFSDQPAGVPREREAWQFEPAARLRDSHPDGSTAFQPLIDPALLFTRIWDWRFRIAGLTAAGFIVGCAVALATPHRYTAYAQLLVDPREIKLVGRDIAPDFLPSEAALAIVDSQLELIYSSVVLGRIVDRLGLDQDSEFNGTSEAFGGIFESVRGFIALFSADNQPEERRRATFRNLRDRMEASRQARTFVVNVSATTRDPEKSALIANEAARAYIAEQQAFQSDSARSASSALGARLDTLRKDVEAAESELEAYKASSGLIGPGGRLVTDDQLAAVTAQLAQARADTITSKSRAEAARGVDVSSVITGGLPQDLTSTTLNALRAQHAAQRRQVAALENALGSRHPKLSDARASLDAVEADIAAEIRRIVAGTQADLRRAVENEQALAASLAQLKAESVGNNDAQIRLRELERRLSAAREIYESFLLRTRETGELEVIDRTNIKVISPADTPESPSSMSRKVIAAGFGFSGFLIGLGLAFLAAFRETLSGGPAGGAHRRRAAAPQATGSSAGMAAPQIPAGARARHEEAATEPVEAPEAPDHPASAGTGEVPEHRYPPYFAHVPHAAGLPPAPPYPAHAWPGAYPAHAWPGAYPPPVAHGAPVAPAASAASAYGYPAAPWPPYAWPVQPQPVPPVSPAEAEELDDLRDSVREIRDTIEALMRRRAARSRDVA